MKRPRAHAVLSDLANTLGPAIREASQDANMPKLNSPKELYNTIASAVGEPLIGMPNIHPADELAAVREEMKILEKQADALRDKLLACTSPLELMGDQHNALIIDGKRETLDRKAIEEAFGVKAVAAFVKTTNFKTVKLLEK